MNLISGLIGAVIGSLVGALVWAGISYWMNLEVGYVAILIGFLAGLGAKMGSRGLDGPALGVLAAVVAIAGVLGGKYLAVNFALQGAFGYGDTETTISYIADEVVRSHERAGEKIRWPRGVDPDEVWAKEDYPPEIWREATLRWNGYSPEEQDELREHPFLANQDYVISWLADDIAEERSDAGEPVEWPRGDDQEGFTHEEDYPSDIWEEANDRWSAWTEDEQYAYRENVKYQSRQMRQQVQQMVTNAGFFASFNFFDLVWALFAIGAAYSTAAGIAGQD